MKIFMVHEDPWHAGNPYIYTLIEGLQKSHPDCEILWGREPFWSDDIFSFDIVHFHWPQTFMGRDRHTEADLLHHIERMRSAGVKVIATCHDLEPHYNQFADKAESMKIVYSHSDAIIHLGEYSKELFEKRYPHAKHILIPHHLYDTVYTHLPSRVESLKYLNLPEDKTYVLCFGAFRAKQECQLIIKLSKQLANRNIIILAPSFMNIWWRSFRMFHKCLKKLYYQYRYNIFCTGSTWRAVSDDDLPYYYMAADVVLIHRLKILNSGNAMMPMLFGKVVVGPNCGNVEGLLSRWGYPVFNVNDLQSVEESVLRGIYLEKKGFGLSIHKTQMNEYSTSIVVERLFSYYMNLLEM
jgi:hypothetical protein